MSFISNLFAKTAVDSVDHVSSTASHPSPVLQQNPDSRLVGEDYQMYGKRLCMKTAGEPMSLAAILQRIYASEKQEMLNNEALQAAHKASIQEKANAINMQIADLNSKNTILEQKAVNSSGRISEMECDIAELKAANGEKNKQANVKFWIGSAILVVLTIYLFIFYSSTFYSAFIHTPEDLSSAMFDPQAIPDAFSHGVMSGLFLCTVPIIFLGLGFGLHYITEQEGIGKYIKGGILVLVTLMFDCILAVAIAKGLYQIQAANSWNEVPEFNISMAAGDLNVWAVIFCGFIVYMIWAVVFDLTVTAYGDIRSNESMIIKLRQQIEKEKVNSEAIKNEILKNQGDIQQKTVAKDNLLAQLRVAVINPNVIFNAFTQFYQGWITTLNAVNLGQQKEIDCKVTYARECKNLLGINIEQVASFQTVIVNS